MTSEDFGQVHSDKIAAARLWLISDPRDNQTGELTGDLPYLAHALYALIPVVSAEVTSVSADEYWRLYINPAWLARADVTDVAAEMVHALWHLLADHAARARDLSVPTSATSAWRKAADLTIGQTIEDARLSGTLPTAAQIGVPVGRSAEEYYAMFSGLPVSEQREESEVESQPPPGCGSACDGIARPHELPPAVDTAYVDEHEAINIRRQVAIAYRDHCTSRGTQPGKLGRWVGEILEPRIAWQPLLARAVRRAIGWATGHTHYTYRKRSRRQSAVPSVLLPGTRRPVPNVVMVIDTSASVDDTLLGQALGEVDGALHALGVPGESVTVLACDAAVQAVSAVRSARDARLAGGGGTDLRVGLVAAEALRPRADLVVVLTDGYTPWPRTPPAGAAVVAAILGRDGDPGPPTPGWAVRVDCRL